MYSVCTGLTQLYLLVEYKVFSTDKYSRVRQVHTLYISYSIYLLHCYFQKRRSPKQT